MTTNPLLDDLRAAFPPQPIAARGAFDQRGVLYCDADEYRAMLDARRWDDLDPRALARRADALSFLGDDYVRAVLPAYLHLLIVSEPTGPVAENLIPLLTPRLSIEECASAPDPDQYFAWVAARFQALVTGLAEPQKRAIGATLKLFGELYPAHRKHARPALERYWHSYVSQPVETWWLARSKWSPDASANVTREGLLEQLRAAFPPQPIDARDAFEHRRELVLDADDYIAQLDGKRWDELDRAFFEEHWDALTFLGSEHLCAILPLQLFLTLWGSPGLPARYSLLPRLTPLASLDECSDEIDPQRSFRYARERFDALVRRLSIPQKRVIARTLQQLVDLRPDEREAADVALDRYWHAHL